ncbi:putative Retinal guanylyl cyclase 2 [Hypsibius exemplaris]|uniref:guanylate cyclase n=1 Tax=Hypsibius exemplaris TaxID=2072580 RepID=A0A1W0X809_HYPEX|nr:putative Retinal guanylyl cyclase 2 [Hypsibius exemplaris]
MLFYETAYGQAKPRIALRSGGAALPASVYKSWNQIYKASRAQYSDINLTYEPVGTDIGYQKFESGEYAFASLNNDLTAEQYLNHSDFQLFPTFVSPISIPYNVPEISQRAEITGTPTDGPGNLNLTRENLVGIFNGSIRFWNDSLLVADNAGLAEVAEKIIVAVRGDAAGTTAIFTRALNDITANWEQPFPSFSDGCYKSGIPRRWSTSITIRCLTQNIGFFVLNTKYSIGYCGSSEARDALLPGSRILNQAGNWVRPNVGTIQAAMDNVSTDLGARLTGSLVNAPGSRSYPIAGFNYILIRKTTMSNCILAMELYRMFSYLLEDTFAQSIVTDLINVPLSDGVLKQVKEQALSQMRCAGASVKELVAVEISKEDGSYDAWKMPVTIVCLLIGAIFCMLFAFLIYVKYTQNRSALRNTFVIGLNVVEKAVKSVGSLHTVASANSSKNNNSKTQTHDTMDWATGTDMDVVKVVGGEQFLVRTMCVHLLPDTMLWPTKVTVVRMKEKLTHANVMKLMGVSFHDGKWKLVTNCPNKGRLQDILHAGKYHLDAVFRYSILTDAADGMNYLHKNGIVHGQLTSNSCYIDARWNVVVGDWEQFALHQAQKMQFIAFESLYAEAKAEPEQTVTTFAEYLRCLFWTSPEAISRDENDIFIVTKPEKPADVYSYGIVAFEVLTDLLPYENTVEHNAIAQPHHIIAAVKMDNLRPKIPLDTTMNAQHVTTLISTTWKREVSQRPTFTDIQKLMKTANPKHRNIVDSMMQALELYALSLEEKVAERTRELEKLTKNMESLLHSMLPPSIADKLSKGLTVEPEFYDSSTIFFSDIVGFTTLAAASSPIDIVTLLNDLYSVNTASRMESSSLPMRIQISEPTHFLLHHLSVYTMVARTDFVVKGKGLMKTYWLTGKSGYANPLPSFDASEDENLKNLLDETQLK